MPDPTTRAYTVKLTGDNNWRNHLWSTHVAVNRGAWAWGEWLLTLRGGLPASLADEHPDRRVILALSWLSVESPATLATAPIIARAGDGDRAENVLFAFQQILSDQGVQDSEDWLEACTPALSARIRDDAVWVNRNAAFSQLAKSCDGLNVDWAKHTLFDFLGKEADYFQMPDDDAAAPSDAKDFVQKAGGWLSRNWGSGEKSDSSSIGEALQSLSEIDEVNVVGQSGLQALRRLHDTLAPCADDIETADRVFKSLKQQIGWKGRPSKGAMALEKLSEADRVSPELWERTKQKLLEESADQTAKAGSQDGEQPWMDGWRTTMESADRIGVPFRCGRDLIWEHGVMFDHALRRVSSAHSWIKRAEVSRRQFQTDAAKETPACAKAWLDQYCEDRAVETGGLRDYVIQKRALDGWDKVVSAWEGLDAEASPQDRIAAARQVQSNMEEGDKLGDMTLFERLAEDDARRVWQTDDGKSAPHILKDYSAVQVARHNQQRFKVPAYRHPDPLRNPIYVDFGNSRWSIEYSALKAAQERPKLQQKLAKAKTEKTKEKLRAQLDEKPNLRGVTLGLWTGEDVEIVKLRWQGKRLWEDLDLEHFDQPGEATVTRADRLGRLRHNVPKAVVTVAEVFQAKDWNGRLQVPRPQLDRLADLVYGETDGIRNGADYARLQQLPDIPRAARQFEHLRWFLTTSAKLKPTGPWWEFLEAGLPPGIEYKKGRSGYFVNYTANKDRKKRARFHLASIPALRVLSFDLGHRYGASCAVWETLTEQSLRTEVQGREIASGGFGKDNLFLHTEHIANDGRKRRTIYRRTAHDMWAKLDRQFVIRLQGEDRVARWALPGEMDGFAEFRDFLGLPSLGELGIEKMRVDELQQEAVREARFGLRRLGDIARIAYALTATCQPLSGGRSSNEFSAEERTAHIAEALARWKELARSRNGTRDNWAAEKWRSYISDSLDADDLSDKEEVISPAVRNRKRKEVIELLQPTAKKLVEQTTVLSELHKLWSERHRQLEGEWKKYLRWLRRLILPRKGDFVRGNVGGLSVSRLQTVRGLYETLKAFRMRPAPDDLRKNVPPLGDESLARFGRRILGQLERLREQRIKQLASRVVEAALGAGRMKPPHGRDRKRPQVHVDQPCHVIVAENLERYRPEETRFRRENRRLMDWAAANVRKYIVEGCELNGLHFEEVSAAYTSQQDSRTGAPGVRCEDIPVPVLRAAVDNAIHQLPTLKQQRIAAWLRAEIKRLPDNESDLTSRQRVLRAAIESIASRSYSHSIARLPRRGGELFVSANEDSPVASGLQADLNAAANVGLKAIMHPDFIGAWWYVLVDRKTGEPVKDQVEGCPLWDKAGPLISGQPTDTEAKKGKRSKERVYAWNPFDGSTGGWKTTSDYKKDVEAKVAADLVRKQTEIDTPW